MHSGLPFDDECARTYLNTNRRWGQGPWSQYASAIIWSIGAMSGEAYLPANMEETVLNTLVMLMGIVVMAFLVGELSNILGNFAGFVAGILDNLFGKWANLQRHALRRRCKSAHLL